ncbi:unnamed protein product, partial [marine sediment metagenome]
DSCAAHGGSPVKKRYHPLGGLWDWCRQSINYLRAKGYRIEASSIDEAMDILPAFVRAGDIPPYDEGDWVEGDMTREEFEGMMKLMGARKRGPEEE